MKHSTRKKYFQPNVPVSVLVAFETLKANFGYSGLQMIEVFIYDMQVRYAMEYHNLEEGDFELRMVYNFRQRLIQHMQETEVDLIEKCFEQITDEQMETYEIKSGRQRKDSTQISSNIRWMSNLQVLVEVLQRVHRMLEAEDQEQFAETFEPYLQEHAGQYVCHLRGKDTKDHVQRITETIKLLKMPFSSGKLPVRGLFRVSNRITTASVMVNMRRIYRYLETKTKEGMKENAQELYVFFSNFLIFVRSWINLLTFDSRFPNFAFSY